MMNDLAAGHISLNCMIFRIIHRKNVCRCFCSVLIFKKILTVSVIEFENSMNMVCFWVDNFLFYCLIYIFSDFCIGFYACSLQVIITYLSSNKSFLS